MASQTPGILRWASSIKNSMINDPGRQFFEDQVQSQGFLFLEEYLDNIWASAKQDSFVDLVKTPGRKRASPQKARQAVTAHPISKALSDEEDVFRCDDLKLSSPPPHTTTTQSSEPIIVDSPPQIRPSPSAVIEKTEADPQPLPSIPSGPSMFVDMSVPLKEEDTSASGGIARNSSLPQFPSLAAPSPLRKSLRNTREPSLEPNLTGTPGTGLTGNHTSWLAKVREAKAIEVTNKRASVAPTFVTPSAGLKRKSDQVPGSLPDDGDDGEERKAKVPKRSADISEASHHLERQPPVAPAPQVPATDVRAAKSADDITTMEMDPEADMMAPLKKAIETLRARTGKSLAGNPTEIYGQEPSPVDLEIATSKVIDDALPQSHALRPSFSAPVPIHKAAAAAKDIILTSTPPKASKANQVSEPTTIPPPREESRRLSVSDLLPKQDRSNASRTSSNEISISTTPPDSPPAAKKTAFFVPGGPVFNKPPPVFVPPPATKPETSVASTVSNVPKGNAPEPSSYSLGAPFGLGLQPTKLPRSPPRNPLSAQSTQSSLFSDNVFGSHNDAPAGVPRSQDTQITSQESQPVVEEGQPADIDDDDSWRIDDKFAETNQLWTPFVGVAAVEDSMTWSTNPSESQIGKMSPRQDPMEDTMDVAGRSHQSQVVADESDEDMDVDDDGEVENDVLEEGKPTVSLVVTNPDATKSQLSMASSIGESSQPVGFFGHATKLVSSMLGVSKKGKLEPPKSIQLAAAAAKKQQEEQDRKAARLKEMEARRQAVLQKKVEGVKVKADEEERKVREDADRRKKGREENTGKRPLVRTDSKLAEEDNTRKRKTTVEVPKVKPPSREKKDAPVTRITKPGQIANSKTTTVTKQPSTTLLNQTTTVKAPPAEKSFVKPAPIPASDKGKSRMIADPEDRQPKKAKQSQSQSQSQSVVPAHPERPKTEPPIASEMIELPEPNSEYSDSEDEGGQRKPEAPEWTQSPELRAALESQSKVNPDDIFGPVRPLRMEDIFRTRTSRFRARTSSANWSGPDGLKQEEEREYAKRMGFQ